MLDMPHPRPPYLQREVTRYDKTVWYVRKERHSPRVRLKAEYGTEEFWQQYQDALSGLSRPQDNRKVTAGSLAWAGRALSRDCGMDRSVIGDPKAAREYSAPRSGQGRHSTG